MKTRGAGVGGDVDRDRPLALGQDRGMYPEPLALISLASRIGSPLAKMAGDRACELIDGVGSAAPANEL